MVTTKPARKSGHGAGEPRNFATNIGVTKNNGQAIRNDVATLSVTPNVKRNIRMTLGSVVSSHCEGFTVNILTIVILTIAPHPSPLPKGEREQKNEPLATA